MRPNNKTVTVIVCLFFLASFLRFASLDSLPIFADESIYMRWSQIMRAEPTLRFLPLSDGKQPFYMWAVIPFQKFISDPLIAGRVLSGLCGLGIIGGVIALSYLLFKNRNLSLLSGLIVTLLPYQIFFDRMALADSMLSLFILFSFIFSLLSIRYLRTDMAMLSGFSLGFAYLTKSPAMFIFFLLPLILIIEKPLIKTRKRFFLSVGLFFITYVIAVAMYNILRLGPEFHMIAIRNKDYVRSFAEIFHNPIVPLWINLKDTFRLFWFLITPVGIFLLFYSQAIFKTSFRRILAILGLWVILPVLAQSELAKNNLTARYFLYILPYVSILISYSAQYLALKTKPLTARLIISVFLIILFSYNLLFIYSPASAPLPRIERSGYLEEWTAGTGIKDVSARIAGFARNGPVVVGSEGFFGTPYDALGMYLNPFPQVRVIGVGVWIDSVSESLQKATKENQVFLVVNSDRFHADPEKIGLKLIASYPKTVRPDGTFQSLYFFQVNKK